MPRRLKVLREVASGLVEGDEMEDGRRRQGSDRCRCLPDTWREERDWDSLRVRPLAKGVFNSS